MCLPHVSPIFKKISQLLNRTVYKLAFKLKKLKTSIDNSVHSASIRGIKTYLESS
jgi:hypothetical protein